MAGIAPALAADRRRFAAAARTAGVDHLCVGDHVSFFVGAGSRRTDHRSLAARRAGRAAGVRRALPAAVAPPGPRRPPARHARRARTRPAHARRRRRRRGPPRARDLRRRPARPVDAGWTSACGSCARSPTASPLSFDGRVLHAARRPDHTRPDAAGSRSSSAADQPPRHAAPPRSATAGSGSGSPHADTPPRYDQIAEQAAAGRPGPERLRARPQRLVRVRRRRGGRPQAAGRRRCRPSTRCRSSRSSATRPTAARGRRRVPRPYIEAGCTTFNVIPCAGGPGRGARGRRRGRASSARPQVFGALSVTWVISTRPSSGWSW